MKFIKMTCIILENQQQQNHTRTFSEIEFRKDLQEIWGNDEVTPSIRNFMSLDVILKSSLDLLMTAYKELLNSSKKLDPSIVECTIEVINDV